MARLFISLPCLDSWIEEGRARLTEDRLSTTEGASYRLGQAVHFSSLVSGVDTHELLGRVKSKAQLQEIGAEHYQDSVIIGEAAYQVVEGFLGEPQR